MTLVINSTNSCQLFILADLHAKSHPGYIKGEINTIMQGYKRINPATIKT